MRHGRPVRPSQASDSRGWFRVRLRAIALVEFGKGALVFVAGVGLLALVHRDIAEVVEELILHLHLNPAGHIPEIFLRLAERVGSMQLWLLAAGAAVYAAVRIAEGYGLWRDRAWAEWLGAVSGLVYVPFELYALAKGVTPLKLVTLAVNVAVVFVLAEALWRRRTSPGERP